MKNNFWILCCLCFMTLFGKAQTKNTSSEVKDYREVDGKIILTLVVNGEMADFVLDLAGQTAILPEYVEKLHIDTSVEAQTREKGFRYRQVEVDGCVSISTMSFGNGVFGNGIPAFVLKDEPYLRQLGVAGIVGPSLFRNTVLTIDSRRKKITMSAPYRPSYMKLDHRVDIELLPASAIVCPVVLDGKEYKLVLDTWMDNTIAFSETDFHVFPGKAGEQLKGSLGYGELKEAVNSKIAGKCSLVKSELTNVSIIEGKGLTRSVLGLGILKEGLLSIDFGKQKVYFQPFDLVVVKDEEMKDKVVVEAGKLNPITRDYFLKHIFDYRKSKDFVYEGEKPVVIDFWATWCGPCMRLLPEMEKLAAKYKDQVIFLKVNADKEKELCSMFNVMALPTLFFIPVGGKPIIEVGATPEKFEQIIQEKLLN